MKNKMKELEDKIINLGVARGYLPEFFEDNGDKQFITQYLRLLKEIGEAADEIRAGNKEAFEMELGDCLVLLTNLDYIVDVVGCRSAYSSYFEDVESSVNNLMCVAEHTFDTRYFDNTVAEERCLKLAYNKISRRDGVLINGDFFKKGDREYIEYFKNK